MSLNRFIYKIQPTPRSAGEGYQAYLEREKQSHLQAIDEEFGTTDPMLAELGKYRDEIEWVWEGAIRAVDFYESNNFDDAQACITRGIQLLLPHFENLLRETEDANQMLVRMRVFENLMDVSTREMFHIAYDQKHKVATQRFSLPGIPCLYAAVTSYTCWEELGRPHLDRVFGLGLLMNSKVTTLDLSLGWHEITALLEAPRLASEAIEQKILATLICWPLIRAVHVKAAHPGSSYIEEYVVPQLLLRWVRNIHEREIHAIRYYSTHVDPRTPSKLASNYVFPTRIRQPEGFCPVLEGLFRFTRPLAWGLSDNVQWTASGGPTGPCYLVDLDPNLDGKPDYVTTKFRQFDSTLRVMRIYDSLG